MPVYTKKDGRIFCVYYDGRHRVWEGFGRGEEARRGAEARDLDVKAIKKRREWHTQGQTSSLRCIDLVQMYLDEKNIELKPRTIQAIAVALDKYALPFITRKIITDITMADWNQIQTNMVESKLSIGTINKYFHYVSNMFSWAMAKNLLNIHPWHKRERLRTSKKPRIELFTLAEFKAILSTAEPHCAWALEVAYYTGARPGPDELFSLKWSNIDWQTGGIHIYCNKTDSWRWQYPDPAFMKKLKAQEKKTEKEYSDCPWIISYQGKQVQSIKRSWKKAKEKAGISRRIRLYDIRHFYITYALASGADVMELAKRVGHMDGTMIMRVYAHLAEGLKRQKPLKIPGLYPKIRKKSKKAQK